MEAVPLQNVMQETCQSSLVSPCLLMLLVSQGLQLPRLVAVAAIGGLDEIC